MRSMFQLLSRHIEKVREIYYNTNDNDDSGRPYGNMEFQARAKMKDLIRAMNRLKGSARIESELNVN
jgi:hypothetical protein